MELRTGSGSWVHSLEQRHGMHVSPKLFYIVARIIDPYLRIVSNEEGGKESVFSSD